MKLTVKQQRFADEYIISGNATDAAKKAGYSQKTARFIGNENLTKPNVKSYIEARMAEINDAAIAKQEEVLQYLTSVMRGESTSEVIVVEFCGDGVSGARHVEKFPDEKERLKAAELLGKRYSIFSDKLNIEGSVPVKFVNDLEDD